MPVVALEGVCCEVLAEKGSRVPTLAGLQRGKGGGGAAPEKESVQEYLSYQYIPVFEGQLVTIFVKLENHEQGCSYESNWSSVFLKTIESKKSVGRCSQGRVRYEYTSMIEPTTLRLHFPLPDM